MSYRDYKPVDIDFHGRKVKEREAVVTLNNGTEIHIAPLYESWHQWGGTTDELWTTVSIADCINDWLHGIEDDPPAEVYDYIEDDCVVDFKDYLDCDLYQVEIDEATGKKVIHIDGYCYFNGEEYQLVQFTFCYMDIDGTQSTQTADEASCLTKQYQYPITFEKVKDYYKDCPPLPYEQVTEDTPVGFYINI